MMNSKLTYVIVDKNGTPDWSKVLEFDQDIVAQVLKKHGIDMADISSCKDGQPRRKKHKTQKKAKSKKASEDKIAKCSDQDENLFKCTECDKVYHEKKQLDIHIHYHNARRYPCKLCDFEARSPKVLEYHLNHHTGNQPFRCTICNQGFGHPTVLATHIKSHRGHKGPVSCQICKMEFDRPYQLDRHLQTHDEKRSHKCVICRNDFKRMMDLQLHIKRYHCDHLPPNPTPNDKLTCNSCNQAFVSKQGLDIHQRRMHRSKMPETDVAVGSSVKHSCTVCRKEFYTVRSFNRHKKSHSNMQPYLCSICGRSFKQSFTLHRHKKMHRKQSVLPCGQCQALFPGRIALRKHMENVHRMDEKTADSKLFKCDTCQRPFTRKQELMEHMNTHTGHHPYMCDTCGKMFSFRSALLCHRKLHGNIVGTAICDICGRLFGSSSRLTDHLVVHTGGRPFVCQHCGSNYKYRSNLRWHLTKAHKKGPGPCGGPRPRQMKSAMPQTAVVDHQTELILPSMIQVQFSLTKHGQQTQEIQNNTHPQESSVHSHNNSNLEKELNQCGETTQLQNLAVGQDVIAVAELEPQPSEHGGKDLHMRRAGSSDTNIN